MTQKNEAILNSIKGENVYSVIDKFLFHCEFEKNLSPKTLQAYQTDLKQFTNSLDFSENSHSILLIDKTVLRKYLGTLTGFSPKSMKRKIATLKAMFSYLEFDDLIPANPFRKMNIRIKEPHRLPVVMDQQEIRRLLKSAYIEKLKTKDKKSYAYAVVVRDITVMELLFATGIRVSELCTLGKQNIDRDSGLVQVTGKGSKERIVQVVDPEVLNILREYFELFRAQILDTGFFFINRLGNRLSDQSVRLMIKKYSIIAKIAKHITPHTFRHTFATLLLEEDVDIRYIQKFLGHSSIVTTQLYTHVSSQKQQQILIAKHPRKSFRMHDISLSE
ncbi:MAG: tyrosine-type recombinase/integrase [Bacteroidetes bacterium]|nr:tyrosine-type recombinase/integrase [Bacteroidota bacterium]